MDKTSSSPAPRLKFAAAQGQAPPRHKRAKGRGSIEVQRVQRLASGHVNSDVRAFFRLSRWFMRAGLTLYRARKILYRHTCFMQHVLMVCIRARVYACRKCEMKIGL